MERDIKKVPTLRGRTIINLFFEASTRTSTSFELAGKRLSADVVNVKGSGSSVEKGETLKDTVITLDAYAPDVLVIRHASVGACQIAARYTDAAVDQRRRRQARAPHPDPARPLHDRARGRAPRRAAHRLRRRRRALARRPLGHPRLPDDGRPRDPDRARRPCCRATPRRRSGSRPPPTSRDLADADVVYVLRMQLERMGPGGFVPSLREYAAHLRRQPRAPAPGPARDARRARSTAAWRSPASWPTTPTRSSSGRPPTAWSCGWPSSTTCWPSRAGVARARPEPLDAVAV